jgi:hypothetical protein
VWRIGIAHRNRAAAEECGWEKKKNGNEWETGENGAKIRDLDADF